MAENRKHRPDVKVIETASGLTPEDEAAFMRQRASAASNTVPEAFLREVEQLNKDYEEKRISRTDLIQRKLEATDKYLG